MNRITIEEERLSALLADCAFFKEAKSYPLLESTNDQCRILAESGAPEGTVVLATEQTKGRGRMGRHFYSPQDNGLYMSLLLRPESINDAPGLITACAAVSAREAIRKLTGISVDIKWVNDLYFENKKLCGILAEGKFSQEGLLSYIVLGIGINLSPPNEGYAPEIRNLAISLAELPNAQVVDRLVLCAEVIRQFADFYNALPKLDFLEIYRSASCVLGKTVSYEKNGEKCVAKALSIDDHAQLVVKQKDGAICTLAAGEINLLRTDS